MNALHQYQAISRQTGVVDVDRHRLIQMLYEGALERITMAKGAMQRKEFDVKNQLISKTVVIIGGLREFLDNEKGGQIAEQLDALYEYMTYRLFEANLHNDIQMLEEVAGLIKEIKEGWDGIREQATKEGLI